MTVTVRPAPAALARSQGRWIAAMEPWLGLGYRAAGLSSFLARSATERHVRVARAGARGQVLGVLVLQPGVLLGSFVALLAVRPEAAGRGIGRMLIEHAKAETFVGRRWLFVSADAGNRAALAFYRKLGFRRVAKLADLVRDGRTEILLRCGARDAATSVERRARPRGQALRRLHIRL